MASQKFTVIIPTRERADVLPYAIATATAQSYPNLEIIVSDNVSTDNTEEVVKRIGDDRVRYINPGSRLSMSHHWEFALEHVKEGWVTLLGDDDGLLPGAIQKALRIADGENVLAVRSNVCVYCWPGVQNEHYGYLVARLKTGYELRDSAEIMHEVMNANMQYTQLPMLYNGGFIHVDLINRARTITKTFYRSMNPDVYSAFALAQVSSKYAYCFEPLAINGTSLHSGGSRNFGGDTKRKLAYDPAEKFFKEDNIPFHIDFPLGEDGRPPLAIQALAYEAYLQSLPLTDKRIDGANHENQAALILSTAGSRQSQLEPWVRQFCQKNSIHFPAPKDSDWRSQISQRFEKAREFFKTKVQTIHDYHLWGSEQLPMRNVFEASIAAAALYAARPRRLQNIRDRLAAVSLR